MWLNGLAVKVYLLPSQSLEATYKKIGRRVTASVCSHDVFSILLFFNDDEVQQTFEMLVTSNPYQGSSLYDSIDSF